MTIIIIMIRIKEDKSSKGKIIYTLDDIFWLHLHILSPICWQLLQLQIQVTFFISCVNSHQNNCEQMACCFHAVAVNNGEEVKGTRSLSRCSFYLWYHVMFFVHSSLHVSSLYMLCWYCSTLKIPVCVLQVMFLLRVFDAHFIRVAFVLGICFPSCYHSK